MPIAASELDLCWMPEEEPVYQAPTPPVDDSPLALPAEAMYGWLKEAA
jgi:hypothetical protein